MRIVLMLCLLSVGCWPNRPSNKRGGSKVLGSAMERCWCQCFNKYGVRRIDLGVWALDDRCVCKDGTNVVLKDALACRVKCTEVPDCGRVCEIERFSSRGNF